jgi:hypothetical protein
MTEPRPGPVLIGRGSHFRLPGFGTNVAQALVPAALTGAFWARTDGLRSLGREGFFDPRETGGTE